MREWWQARLTGFDSGVSVGGGLPAQHVGLILPQHWRLEIQLPTPLVLSMADGKVVMLVNGGIIELPLIGLAA